MEDDPKESCHATNSKERLRLIKEERRKQHEQRLGRASLFPAGLGEESDTIKRFSKYRRSGSDRASRKVDQPLSSRHAADEGVADCSSKSETVPEPDLSREHLWNVSPAYEPAGATEGSSGVTVRSNETVANSLSSWGGPSVEAQLSGDFTGSSPSPGLTASLSLDQSRGVLKKPSIPNILRSASATEPATAFSGDDDVIAVKKPSILKKKDDSSSSATPSNSGNGQSASVSFGLPVTTSVLSRTKSIDSNLSGDTETGYWSGCESVGGILKSRRFPSDVDQSDQSSIMKSRRSSFGSSVASNSGSSEGGLQSILKRKLSYDSSYIMKEANLNEYSFSTHSLPACGCMSPEPKPILKKKSNSEDLDEVEPKPILKHRTSRDCPEVTVESEKTIKPCLKKSSSKSVDETLPGSASVNFSPSFPPSVSPVSAVNDGSSPSSKGILKRGGILKNAWRESSSTSTSSSSSELDNSRTFQSAENEGDELSSSFLHQVNLRDSSQGLGRAQRFYRSEGDINADERGRADRQMVFSDPASNVNDTVPLSFPSMFFNRCDDPAAENGQACSNNSLEQQQQKQPYDHQSLDLSEEKNPRRTYNSGGNTHRSSSYPSAAASSSSLFASSQASVDDNSENVAPEGYSSLLTPGKNKFSGSSSLKPVSPTPPRKLWEFEGSEERVIVGVPESKYKVSSRRTSLRSSNPASSEEPDHQVNIPQLLNDSPFDTFASSVKNSFEHGSAAEKKWIPPPLHGAERYRSNSVAEEHSSAIRNNNYYLDDCHHEGESKTEANSVSTKKPLCSRNTLVATHLCP